MMIQVFVVFCILFSFSAADTYADNIVFENGDIRVVAECVADVCVYTDLGSGTRMTCQQARARLTRLQARNDTLLRAVARGDDTTRRELCMIGDEMQVLHAITDHGGCAQSPPENIVPRGKKRGEHYVQDDVPADEQ